MPLSGSNIFYILLVHVKIFKVSSALWRLFKDSSYDGLLRTKKEANDLSGTATPEMNMG